MAMMWVVNQAMFSLGWRRTDDLCVRMMLKKKKGRIGKGEDVVVFSGQSNTMSHFDGRGMQQLASAGTSPAVLCRKTFAANKVLCNQGGSKLDHKLQCRI